MREILFRGKDPETGIWYEGQYIHLHKTTYCFAEDYEDLSGNDIHQIVFERMTDWGLPNQHLRVDVDPSTVGQYTGLKDKNGKKIFEGDYIKIDGHDDMVFEVKYIGSIVGFSLRDWVNMRFEFISSVNVHRMEVIGNINDNPELLKGGEEK